LDGRVSRKAAAPIYFISNFDILVDHGFDLLSMSCSYFFNPRCAPFRGPRLIKIVDHVLDKIVTHVSVRFVAHVLDFFVARGLVYATRTRQKRVFFLVFFISTLFWSKNCHWGLWRVSMGQHLRHARNNCVLALVRFLFAFVCYMIW